MEGLLTPTKFLYRRVASHIWSNHTGVATLEWIVGVLVGWLTIISLALGYGYSRCSCMKKVEQYDSVSRRESCKQEPRNLNSL